MAILLNPSTITLAQAKASVCRVAGTQNDDDEKAAAAEHLRDAMFTLNNKRDWTWLQNATTINSTASQATITVPTRLKKVYSVKTPTETLRYINERDQNRQNPMGQAVGGTYFYKTFNLAETGVILLVDAPATTTAITLNYIRLLTIPSADGNTFDVPESVMDYVLSEARARYLTEKEGPSSGKVAFWADRANRALGALIADDVRVLDHDSQFAPDWVEVNMTSTAAARAGYIDY